ncbi:MAG: hypothetical protein ACI39Q_03115 [Wujia sp.]
MNIIVIKSVVYILELFALLSGGYMYRKSENRLHGATWIPVTALAVMGYQTLMAAVLSLVHLPVNIVSIGICDLLAALALWWCVLRTGKIQYYKYSWSDAVVWCVLACVVLWFAVVRYGGTALCINYNSVDGVAHFAAAMRVVKGQDIDAMYFAALHNGLMVEMLAPVFSPGTYYKIYVLGDVLYLLLAGLIFWGLIRRYCTDRYLAVAGIIVTVLYVLGYPENSTLFGSSYLGLCITVIAYVLAVADMALHDELPRWLGITMLSLGCLSVFESYVLFMPIVFFSILLWMLWTKFLDHKLFSLETIWTGLGIFLIPTAIGLWFTYRGIFGAQTDVTVTSQIALEGGIYRNFLNNFVILLPFAFCGYMKLVKEKKNSLILYMIPLQCICTLGMAVQELRGRVSGYYYYKNYYIVWLLLFFLAFVGLGWLEKKTRVLVNCGFAVWCVMVLMMVFNIESYLVTEHGELYGRATVTPYFDIYAFNRDFLRTPGYSTDKLELFRYICEDMIEDEDTSEMLLMGDAYDVCWMQAICGNLAESYTNADDMIRQIQNQSRKYIVIMKDSDTYGSNPGLYDSLNKIYETPGGFIAETDETFDTNDNLIDDDSDKYKQHRRGKRRNRNKKD